MLQCADGAPCRAGIFASAFFAGAGAPAGSIRIGNPTPEISVNDLAKVIEEVLGREVVGDRVEYPDSYPADEPQRRCPDIRKAQLQLRYRPEVPLAEGLKRFLGWADEHYAGSD